MLHRADVIEKLGRQKDRITLLTLLLFQLSILCYFSWTKIHSVWCTFLVLEVNEIKQIAHWIYSIQLTNSAGEFQMQIVYYYIQRDEIICEWNMV